MQGLACEAGLEPGGGLGGGLRPQVGAGWAVLGEEGQPAAGTLSMDRELKE